MPAFAGADRSNRFKELARQARHRGWDALQRPFRTIELHSATHEFSGSFRTMDTPLHRIAPQSVEERSVVPIEDHPGWQSNDAAHTSCKASEAADAPFVFTSDPVYDLVKRAMDVFGSVIIGIAFLITLPILSVIIRLDSPGSVFYRQMRVGKDEKEFTILKLRSMRNDAERDGVKWASSNDNRVTRVGRLMRNTRIDELPQVWNVLKGEMSLVGPRPERPEFVATLETEIPNYHLRHLVKPGVTGWAQSNMGYTDTIAGAAKKLEYDLYYVENRSIALDIRVLAKTVIVVLRLHGQ